MKGKAWKFGDDIDTDIIIPGRYLIYTDEETLSSHCMEGLDKDFSEKFEKGDVILAGRNFGCGSSREHAPIALKGLGVSYVIAESFARIFYRNAINIGLPVIVSDIEAKDEDVIEIDLSKGTLVNETTGESTTFEPFKEFMLSILEDGGLVNHYLKDE